MSIIDLAKTASPGAPASGFSRLYVDTNGSLHVILDNGTDVPLGISVNNGSGAPVDAKYLVLGLSDGLTNERVFSTGEGLEYVDGGPGGILEMRLGAHKLKHSTGGSDPLTPSDIGGAEVSHTHDWSDILDPPSAGAGDMTKAVYDADDDGKVDSADAADSVPWTGVQNRPATYPPSTHNHDDRYYTETQLSTAGQAVVDWDNIANAPAGAAGDMEKTVYDPDNDGKVEAADAADTVPWTGVQNPPATYAPSAHAHDDRYYTEAQLNTSGGGAQVHWDNLTNKPAIGSGDMVKTVYDPDDDGKVEAADAADSVPWTGVSGKPATFAPSAHTHPGTEVTTAVANANAVPWSGVTSKPLHCLNVILGDGVNVITTGVKGYFQIPFACAITKVQLVGDAVGTVSVNIWKDTFANFPPTIADTIVASAKPNLASAQKYEDATLTGWNKTVSAGDWLAFYVDGTPSTVKQVTLVLTLQMS